MSGIPIRYHTHQSNFLKFGQSQRRLGHGPGKFILGEGYAVCQTVGMPIHMAVTVAIRDRLYLLQRVHCGGVRCSRSAIFFFRLLS